MSRRKPQPRPIVFEHRKAIHLGLAGNNLFAREVRRKGQFLGQVVVFAQEMAMCLSGVFLAAHGFHDVLAVEDANQAVDLRDIVEQLRLVTLNEAPGYDHALAAAALFLLDSFANRAAATRSWRPRGTRRC